MVFYNDNDPFVAKWLRNLIDAGHVPHGIVDERSISDLELPIQPRPSQCHFFAGIGGWACALKLAGWPDDQEVWTGSCPCQPFSVAGRKKAQEDPRHLWPIWFRLIDKHRPSVVFGEQVASPDGQRWLDLVSSDLEGAGYAFGAANLCAAGVGAPHIRQRLYFVAIDGVAITDIQRRKGIGIRLSEWEEEREVLEAARDSALGCVANPLRPGRAEGWTESGNGQTTRRGSTGLMGDSGRRHAGAVPGTQAQGPEGRETTRGVPHEPCSSSSTDGPCREHFWRACEWIPCRDGKFRPVEPGSFPLAFGLPGRVGRLRAYGNAIVPQVAAVFIRAVMDFLA